MREVVGCCIICVILFVVIIVGISIKEKESIMHNLTISFREWWGIIKAGMIVLLLLLLLSYMFGD